MEYTPINYGSVCSGVEAATLAWHGLGWRPQWFSQFDPEHNYKRGPDFPSQVLAHHYPDVPNIGDMTKIIQNQIFNDRNIRLLVGGTPCQSFSVAGLRNGLSDERGNLSLEFVRLLVAKQPDWFVWENVPGVLSSGKGNDFASILSAFTGRSVDPQKFGRAGIIEGDPESPDGAGYSIAYRIFDSRYFGVPQRRRRIFVVGYRGADWRPPVAVLFERESLRRDFTPSGNSWQRTAAEAAGSIGGGRSYFDEQRDAEYGTNGIASTLAARNAKEASDLIVTPYTPSGFADYTEGVGTLKKDGGDIGGGSETLITTTPPSYGIPGNWIGRKPENGGNAIEPMHDVSPCLTKTDRHAVVINDASIFEPKSAMDENWAESTVKNALRANASKSSHCVVQPPLVRRLTPLECERLQGFPDGYTFVNGAADGNRYKVTGNSMTVNVMKYIGAQIDKVDRIIFDLKNKK